MSTHEEAEYFRDTIKRLLKFPLQYPIDYLPVPSTKTLPQRKHPRIITLKALGRSDVLTLNITNNYMNVGDIRARAMEWCGCTKDDTMRLLIKGKALNDDTAKVISLSEEDTIVINVIVKKHTPLPHAFMEELEMLFEKHHIPDEAVNRIKNALQ
jgi:hypothetical protein